MDILELNVNSEIWIVHWADNLSLKLPLYFTQKDKNGKCSSLTETKGSVSDRDVITNKSDNVH